MANEKIRLSDGVILYANIWLPEDARRCPVPAVLDYVPYRKDDMYASGDSLRYPYFATHGYASVRVDMRGSGNSDGILRDEYLPLEQGDALEVLRWISEQWWCSGPVGMTGISWGGFNSLQVAALRPPELKAVISVASTDDRYADDVHYMGGCLLASDMLSWATSMRAFNALPPDPAVVGERWSRMWTQRLEQTPAFIEAWLSHQRRDPYWKQGSVCENYNSIDCPVYMVGGWADAYAPAILRFLAGFDGPRKGLIGPWGHTYPETGLPGPAIGFLQECLRWWDHWLKGVETGIMAEPMLRVWMQESVVPASMYTERPGRWISEASWPPDDRPADVFFLGEQGLVRRQEPESHFSLRGSQGTGVDAGNWCPYGRPGDFPPDQREEDGRSLTFTSPPLLDRMEILGSPALTISLAVDRPQALLCARLCDVHPSGESTLITRGLINLSHRDSHEHPSPMIPGQRYDIVVPLKPTAYSLPAGHRLRLALSPTYWPWAWPSPEPVTLTVYAGSDSVFEVPVRLPRVREDALLVPFLPPETAEPLAVESLRSGAPGRGFSRDFVTGRQQMTFREVDEGWRIPRTGIEFDHANPDRFTIIGEDPLSASVHCSRSISVGRGGWRIRVVADAEMTADSGAFTVSDRLDAYCGSTRVFTSASTFIVPRDNV